MGILTFDLFEDLGVWLLAFGSFALLTLAFGGGYIKINFANSQQPTANSQPPTANRQILPKIE